MAIQIKVKQLARKLPSLTLGSKTHLCILSLNHISLMGSISSPRNAVCFSEPSLLLNKTNKMLIITSKKWLLLFHVHNNKIAIMYQSETLSHYNNYCPLMVEEEKNNNIDLIPDSNQSFRQSQSVFDWDKFSYKQTLHMLLKGTKNRLKRNKNRPLVLFHCNG